MNPEAIPAQMPGTGRAARPVRSRWLEALSRHAAERPGAVAVAEVSPDGAAGRTITYARLFDLALSRAGLIAGAMPTGQSLVAAIPSGIDLAAWFVAAINAGARLALMHPRCGRAEFEAVAAKTRARAMLACEHTDGSTGRWTVLDPGASEGPARARPLATTPPGSIVLGSSGTTGLPKLAVRESPALDADAVGIATGMRLSPEDVVLCVPPLCHSYGVDVLLGTLFSGASLHVMGEFDAAGAAEQIRAGVTVIPGVPFMYEALGRATPRGAARPRLALSAGSALSDAVRNSFRTGWGIDIGQLYGATELGTVAIHRPDEPDFDPLAIGRPLDGAAFRILDTSDREKELPVGQEGELAVRALSMFSRYLDGDAPVVDGYFLTGDLARLDDAGRAAITGRLKLLIDTGGFKVNPLEVEATLRQHPQVADCAVAALALSETIRRVQAFVEPKDTANPPTDRDLRAFLRDRLASSKIPRVFHFVPSLPRSPLGKLLRDQLPGAGC